MKPPAEEAKQHEATAQKALKTSAWTLKFSPDFLTASMEYAQAATKYRAAGLLTESVNAWVRSGELKEQQNDLHGAGRAYESAGQICDGNGPGGPAAAVEHWHKAIRCFRFAGKPDISAKLLLKMAGISEKTGDVGRAKASYEEAIEVFKDADKEYELADIYKQKIGLLVRSGDLEEAMLTIDEHIKVLSHQKHWPFVHKEMLAKVVLALQLGDTVRADAALGMGTADVEGWYMSKECQYGTDLVQAFQESDPEAAERIVKEQVFTFLQVEVARIARTLRVKTIAAPVSAPAGGVSDEAPNEGEGGGAAPQNYAEMLM